MDGYFGSILFVSVFVFYCYITNYHKFSNLNNTHLLLTVSVGHTGSLGHSAQHPTRLKSKVLDKTRYDFMWNSEFSFIFTSICRIQFLMVVKWNPHFFFTSCPLVLWLSELRNLPQVGPNHRTPSQRSSHVKLTSPKPSRESLFQGLTWLGPLKSV